MNTLLTAVYACVLVTFLAGGGRGRGRRGRGARGCHDLEGPGGHLVLAEVLRVWGDVRAARHRVLPALRNIWLAVGSRRRCNGLADDLAGNRLGGIARCDGAHLARVRAAAVMGPDVRLHQKKKGQTLVMLQGRVGQSLVLLQGRLGQFLVLLQGR